MASLTNTPVHLITTPLRPVAAALVALSLLPALLAAQDGRNRPAPRCAAYDSLITGARHTRPGSVSVNGVGAGRKIHVVGALRIDPDDRGILGVGGTIQGAGLTAVDSASVQVNVQVAEQEERPIEMRQGTLVLDDSTSLDLGTLTQTPGIGFPNGKKTWYLFGFAPRGTLLKLARAGKAEITIGQTRWRFPDRALESWRGALAAYVCPATATR